MTRVAAIDCGTNSIRLLIAEPGEDGALVDVAREMRIVRLGQGVDRTGRLAPEAIARAREALVEYTELIDKLGASAIRMVATSATRDAINRDEFTTMVRAVLGAAPEVITGAEEAALSFAGAVAGLPDAASPVLVADIGGGSTELVLGHAPADGGLASYSMDIGCVRMTERHLRADPPSAAQFAATVADVRAAIGAAARDVPIERAATFVGVAGTVTTLAAIEQHLSRYDPERIHRFRLTRRAVDAMTGRLLAMTVAERREIRGLQPERADVILAGALVLRYLLAALGCRQITVSEADLLWGLLLEPLPRGAGSEVTALRNHTRRRG